jgi:hypothetical protein
LLTAEDDELEAEELRERIRAFTAAHVGTDYCVAEEGVEAIVARLAFGIILRPDFIGVGPNGRPVDADSCYATVFEVRRT